MIQAPTDPRADPRHGRAALLSLLALACVAGCENGEAAERLVAEGVARLQAGEHAPAFALCSEALRQSPERPGARACAALAALGLQRWDRAEALLGPLRDTGETAPGDWVALALWLCRVQQGDREGARALLAEPGAVEDGTRLQEAMLAALLAARLDPEAWGFDATRLEGVGGLLARVAASRAAGGGTRGADAAEILAALLPRPEGAPGRAGLALLADPDALLPDCQPRKEASDPRDAGARQLLQGICLERQGRPEEALAAYDRALAAAPYLAVARLDRVLLLARQGRLAEARAELAALAEDRPGQPLLAVVLALVGSVDADAARRAALRDAAGALAPAWAQWIEKVLED